jgi:hypothetical protein
MAAVLGVVNKLVSSAGKAPAASAGKAPAASAGKAPPASAGKAPPASDGKAPPASDGKAPAAPEPRKRIDMTEIVKRLISKGTYPIRNVIPMCKNIRYMYLGVWAIIGICVLILLLLLLLYLVYRLNPRMPWINRSVNLEGYMEETYESIEASMTTLRSGLRDMRGSAAFRDMPGSVSSRWQEALQIITDLYNKHGPENVKTGIQIYFAFGQDISSLTDNPGSRAVIRGNAEHLFVNDKTGEISASKVKEFTNSFLKPLDKLSNVMVDLSNAMHDWGDNMRWSGGTEKGWDQEDVYLVTCIHECRMMLEKDHLSKVRNMLATRQNVSPMAIWTLYYWPDAKTLIMKRIPNIWRKVPVSFPRRMQQFFDWWGRIGILFATLPCYSAFSDPAERHRRCKTGQDLFTQQEQLDADDEQIETFGLGGIVSALKSVGTFFINIASMGIGIAQLFIRFPVDPFGTIIGLISILIGTIVGFILMLMHMMQTITGMFFVWAFIYALFMVILSAVFMTIFYIVFAILTALPYFGLWLVDLPTKGLVVRLMRCENEPSSWYKRNSYAKDNLYSRIVPFCLRPCSMRYRPFAGCCCAPLKKHIPDKCPQQHVYTMYKNKGLGTVRGPVSMARYKPESNFGGKTVPGKKAVLLSVYSDKVEMYGECYKNLGDKDFVTQHLCRMVDILQLSKKDRKIMETLCNECFCKYEPDGFLAKGTVNGYRTGRNNRRSCDLVKDADGDGTEDSLSTDLFRRVLMLLTLVTFLLVIIFALIKSGARLTD